MEGRKMKINHSLVEKVTFLLISALFFVSSAFGGTSRDSRAPAQNVVMIVTVKLKGESPEIDRVVVQKGLLNPIRQDDTKLLPSVLAKKPRLVLVDLLGNIFHVTEFEYLRVMTIPPGPPGSPKNDLPSVVLLEEPEITLVAPYFCDVDTVRIINPGETEPATTKSILDAEFSEELDEGLLIEPGLQPAPSQPESLTY